MTQFDPLKRNLSKGQRILQRLFPERQLVLREGAAVRILRLGTTTQIAACVLTLVITGWTGFTSWTYLDHQGIVGAKEAEATEARRAYQALLSQVGVYREKVSQVAESLELNHRYTLTILNRADDLGQRLSAVESELASSEAEKDDALREKDALVGHLRKLRSDLKSAVNQGEDGKAQAAAAPTAGDGKAGGDGQAAQRQEAAARERENLRAQLALLGEGLGKLGHDSAAAPVADLEMELRQMVLQRDQAQSQNAALQQEVAALKAQVSQMETTQIALFQRFSSLAQDRIGDLETMLGKTGLRAKDLMERSRSRASGQGGPFVPLDMGTLTANTTLRRTLTSLNTHLERWSSLQGVVDNLPLGKPVRDFHVTSGFGVRRDPFNGSAAIHQGMDLAAPVGTPVYATAPGRVVFAGWRGRYGRLIEIDHGNGMKTRFGHLNKILVRKGDVVDRGNRIGLVGNSGRSSGPHVHYEVLVNGTPRNPDRFIRADANVFKG